MNAWPRRHAEWPCVACVPALVCLALAPARAQACDSMEALTWLLGAWRSEAETTLFLERWERHPDGHFEGRAESRSIETDEVFLVESLRLEPVDGTLQYVATVPHNEGPVAFPLVRCDEDAVVFENPAHDFPQRIIYRRAGADAISAHITDLEDEGFDLHFQRFEP